jgi:sec-independent protein translocase protein TatB
MSLPDSIFIFVIALMVFGPRKLPEMARQLGRLMAELRRASNDFKFQIEEELRQSEASYDKSGPALGPTIHSPEQLPERSPYATPGEANGTNTPMAGKDNVEDGLAAPENAEEAPAHTPAQTSSTLPQAPSTAADLCARPEEMTTTRG